MGQYGDVALQAVELIRVKPHLEPQRAWERAARGLKGSSREKLCPKGAFVGLRESGAVVGVAMRRTLSRSDNGDYAVTGLAALRKDPTLAHDKTALWILSRGTKRISHNGQMDVLLSFLEAGHLD